MQDIYVKHKNSQELGLTRTPKLEQAMAWLIEHGPTHVNPPLPAWMLHDLVQGKRIANLRRGVYLAPTESGAMWSLPAVATQLEPSGYLSFYGALVLHGLTDQDSSLWGYVLGQRQSSLRYGQQRLDFVHWPRRVRSAKAKLMRRGDEVIRLATPTQAFTDALEAPRYVTSWPELLHVLRTGIALGKLSAARLRARAIDTRSPALARRLGLLLELETGKADPELLALAQRSNTWTRLAGLGSRVAARDARWRVELPRSREDLLAAVRD